VRSAHGAFLLAMWLYAKGLRISRATDILAGTAVDVAHIARLLSAPEAAAGPSGASGTPLVGLRGYRSAVLAALAAAIALLSSSLPLATASTYGWGPHTAPGFTFPSCSC
jgi:hypothetical protein